MILPCMYMPHLVRPFLIEGHVGWFYILAVVNVTVSMSVQIPLFETLLSVLNCVYTEVEFPDHIALFLIFWGTSILFHSSCVILHSHPRRTPGSNFSTPHPHRRLSFSVFLFWPSSEVWNDFIVALICLSLVISDTAHILMCLLAVCMSWKNIYSSPLFIF